MRRKRTPLILVGLFVWVTACSTYTQIGIGEVADHGKVRVTTTNGARQTLRDPWVESDSVRSFMRSGGYTAEVPLSIPIDDIAELEAVGTNEVGIALIVSGMAVVILILAFCTDESRGATVTPCS